MLLCWRRHSSCPTMSGSPRGRWTSDVLVAKKSTPHGNPLGIRHRDGSAPDGLGLDQAPTGQNARDRRVFEAKKSGIPSAVACSSVMIATFYSRFSSANNHLIAEMAGFAVRRAQRPLFAESEAWASHAASILEREMQAPDISRWHEPGACVRLSCVRSGVAVDRRQRSRFAGRPLSNAYWQTLCRMADSLAALVDVLGKTARQGDSDSGRALLLDAPSLSPVTSVLDTCELDSKPHHGGVTASRVALARACWPGSCSLVRSLCRIDLPSVQAAFPSLGLRCCAIFSHAPTSCGAAWIMGPMGSCPPPLMLMPMRCRSSCVKAGRRPD